MRENVVVTAVTAGLPVPVTVKVYVPVVVPAAELPEGASQKSPHADKTLSAANAAMADSIRRQVRRRAGIPRKTTNAKTALPAPNHVPSLGRRRGRINWLVVAAVVAMVAVTVPLVFVELSTTVVGEMEQVGSSTAPDGEVVSAQASVAVPA